MIWRACGALAVVTGLVLAAVAGWNLWGTDLRAAAAQDAASNTLTQQWAAGDSARTAAEGEPLAVLRIPRLGPDWSRVIVEGVEQADLDKGPGHYPGTAEPGQVGNFAVAGHRVGNGAPFDDLDELQPCDPIEVETQRARYVYRVLPYGETACALPGDGLPGRQIVTPDRGDLILPVPGQPQASPSRAVLTLTTCHPRYSAKERLIVHAVLAGVAPVG